MRFFIELSYNGKNYFGWQKQPHSLSVQEELERAISLLLHEEITLVGAGRTDTGVHARDYFAHFDFSLPLPENLVNKLNSFLPKTIAIKGIFPMKDTAHARFDALSRTYQYFISREKNPFLYEQSYYVYQPLAISQMNRACEILLRHNDFQCFSKTNTDVRTYICHLTEAFWREEDSLLIFRITADRFLRNMVRAIVGTMIEVGIGKISLSNFEQILLSKNRSQAGYSVPGHALFLEKVVYPKEIFLT
ncbi:tRNA pseudouridine(38-40) synthase TruA [Capnocytophaga sp. G2]|uniref:tRNA pseudouridine(38-40) synthase TruA n=1 Tax=Capnocytophaga sp. G2 TaxID=3110695 RepID=UPI002B470E54|nr:tRNA pseudouridine(38-40) synthase TruA [Capnocytophaga sp. G2]MEB3004398.1 tRNA pseudouridine(38-40) synthase TruA [Capnocytophaga sp. G2]